MYIEQLYTRCLAEAAYYIESNGEAAIIDPLRETAPYLEKARENGATIKYIFETHFHADFVSGHIDLAQESGATIVYGPGAHTNYNIHTATDGEVFHVGNLTLKVLHTPGHTLESSTYLLKDADGKEHCIFSGDTLFIGDVGRPDLAVKSELTKEDLAGMLFDSLRNKIMPLPDDVIVYPAHGAGSSCGKSMSTETFDTLGHQKKVNYALRADMTRSAFIREVTEGILPPPAYFPENVRMNKLGYDSVTEVMNRGKNALTPEAFQAALESGALLIDTRNHTTFAEGYIPNSLFVGLNGNFASWVGTVVPDIRQKIVLLAEPGTEAEAVMRLARVGYDQCVGYLEGGWATWVASGLPVATIQNTTPEELVALKSHSNIAIVDVRKPGEFEDGHIDGAQLCSLNYIYEQAGKLESNRQYYVHCKSGYRSVIAISILKRMGITNLFNIPGGFDALLKTGIPVTGSVCSDAV